MASQMQMNDIYFFAEYEFVEEKEDYEE